MCFLFVFCHLIFVSLCFSWMNPGQPSSCPAAVWNAQWCGSERRFLRWLTHVVFVFFGRFLEFAEWFLWIKWRFADRFFLVMCSHEWTNPIVFFFIIACGVDLSKSNKMAESSQVPIQPQKNVKLEFSHMATAQFWSRIVILKELRSLVNRQCEFFALYLWLSSATYTYTSSGCLGLVDVFQTGVGQTIHPLWLS